MTYNSCLLLSIKTDSVPKRFSLEDALSVYAKYLFFNIFFVKEMSLNFELTFVAHKDIERST